MHRIIKNLIFTSAIAFCSAMSVAQAAYYDTLPKGVRVLEYRYITTSNINSSFTGNKAEADYSFKLNMDANSLAELNEVTKDIFDYVKGVSEDAFNQFSFGEYEIDGRAQVDVQVIGAAYGITNKLFAYAGIPIYHGRVDLQIIRTKGNNHKEVAKSLVASGNGAEAQIFGDFASQLPDANGELLQSAVVNYLGYQPIGNWEATDLGDIEVGLTQQLKTWKWGGLAATGGLNLPTGRTDDPDIIQDIPFGDGQLDVFGEFGGGIILPHTMFSFDSFARYTYQTAKTKELRIPDNPNYKEVALEKGLFKEKLGDIFDFNLQANAMTTDWLTIFAGYQYRYQAEAKYDSEYNRANSILAQNTMSETHFAKLGASLSTLNLYRKGKFFLPCALNVSGRKTFAGRNHPKYTRYDLEMRFFF